MADGRGWCARREGGVKAGGVRLTTSANEGVGVLLGLGDGVAGMNSTDSRTG